MQNNRAMSYLLSSKPLARCLQDEANHVNQRNDQSLDRSAQRSHRVTANAELHSINFVTTVQNNQQNLNRKNLRNRMLPFCTGCCQLRHS